MVLTKDEITKRLKELRTKEPTEALKGEMFGLAWVLKFWDTGYYEKPKDNNIKTVFPPY